RKPIYPELENELVEYIKKKREEKIAVTTSMIKKKAKELGETLVIKNFLKISQEKTSVIENQFIISFDETPMWFDMPCNSTYDFKGVREVPIKTTGSDKLRFTVVLGYTASGVKLPPMTKCFFKCKGIIFVDGHRSHIRDDVKRAFMVEGLDLLEIPGGTTSVLQSPDVSINKLFKNRMRQRWEEWIDKEKVVLTKNGNRKKASYELVSEWVSKTWKEISSNMLVRSFETTGLTLNPDGSEDHKMSDCLRAIVEDRLRKSKVSKDLEELKEFKKYKDLELGNKNGYKVDYD
ncbi:28829_t:CDS:2, partial [Dentiscutata erythropus]